MTIINMNDWSQENALQLHMLASRTHQQAVAPAERAGQLLCQIARAISHESKLPTQLWPEFFRTAAYLANRTPSQALNWQYPIGVLNKMLGKDVPSIANLDVTGSEAYIKLYATKRAQG